jgi:glycosyltransferase involved in cell wall biosynthesis
MPQASDGNAGCLNVAPHLSFSDFRAARKLLNLLQPGEIVHAHGIRAGWISAWARRLRRFPLVVTLHNVPPATFFGRLAVRFISGRSDRLIAVSQAIAAVLPPHQTQVIPNGIEVERFHNGNRTQSRLMLNIEENAFVVGCIARLSREKGVDLLLEAASQCPEMLFVVAGDGPERASLARSAPQNARFLKQVEDVAPLLKAFDLLALPSRSEGQGIVALEAFASGCPVLAARVGGLAETVRDGVTGLLFEPENSAALKNALERLASDASLRDVLCANALTHINRFGRAEQMCRAIEAVYHEVVTARR